MDTTDVEKFLVSLGSLLPSEAVRTLADEVKRQHMDGARFDTFISSRVHPGLGGVVRPAHLAILRRCWLSKRGGAARASRMGSTAGSSVTRNSHFGHGAPSEASAATVKRASHPAARPPSRSATRLSEAEEATQRSKSLGAPRPDSKKRFVPPPRSSSHTPATGGASKSAATIGFDGPGGGLTATTAAGTSEGGLSCGSSKGKAPSSEVSRGGQSSVTPPPDKLAVTRHQSMRTVQEIHGTPSEVNNRRASAPTPARRTRSANDLEPPIATPLKPRKFRRPPQVPPLDFSFIYKGKDQDAYRKAKEAFGVAQKAAPPKPNASVAAQSEAAQSHTTTGGFLAQLPPGFSAATAEDQRRIATFYGYRHDGFAATMHGLRTDEIRPRLFLGTMADAAYWPLLKALGVTHILNCAVEAQKTRSPYEPHGLRYMLLPLQDTPETAQLLCKQHFRALREATKFIHGCLKSKNQHQAVFVHCVQGLSRSAAIVCAYLMEYEGMSMDRAMAETRNRRKGCLTSHHWQAMLYKFNSELHG